MTDSSTIASVTLNGTSMVAIGSGKYQANITPQADFGCSSGACTLLFTATDIPGNTNNTETVTITVDGTNPSVSNPTKNATLIGSSSMLRVNVTVTDNNLSTVYVGSGSSWNLMTHIGSNIYQANKTGTQLGCTSSGTCTIRFNATDEAGNTNTSTTTTVQVDNTGPAVTNASVTNTTSGRAKAAAQVNIQVDVNDALTSVGTVEANGQTMYLLSGNTYHANLTAGNLGCGQGTCTITINATDSFGNYNDSVTTSYVVDDSAPGNTTAFSASATTTSATISATMNESAKCTVIYGTNASVLSSSANSSTFASTMSVALSGLSASTTYYYNITDCWDELGNSATLDYGTFNFTTSASTGGGGGGGGGGGSAVLTYDVGDFTGAESDWSLGRGDKVNFGHDGEEHMMKVLAVRGDYAVLEISSDPQQVTLYIGQSADVDLNADTKADIRVKLLDIIYYKALVKVTSLAKDADKIFLLPPAKPRQKGEPVEPVVEEVVKEEAAAPAPAPVPEPIPAAEPEPVEKVGFWQKLKTGWYWYAFGALVAVIAIIIIALFILEHKRRKGPEVATELHSFGEGP